MRVFSKSQVLIGMSAFVLVLVGCSTAPIKPETQSIKMLIGGHNLAHCQFLGDVMGASTVNLITRKHPPYTTRMSDARNNIRNETYQLGGNTIHIRRTDNTSRYEFLGLDKKITLEGKAYSCDES